MQPASFGACYVETCVHPRRNGSTGGARKEIDVKHDRTQLPKRLEGLPGNLCQCPHWGTVLKGSIHVRFSDGTEEVVRAGEVYYWPPGHTVWVDEDYEAVEFSPAGPMGKVIDHLNSKLQA